MHLYFSKWYTRVIGIFFILVSLSLVSDFVSFGFRPETMHKIFHVLLGVLVVYFGWKSEAWWKTFPIVNGMYFSFVALFGWIFPDFGGLDAFNFTDTILHSIVAVSGIVVYAVDRNIRNNS